MKGGIYMKVFNINSIIDSIIETVRESIDIEGYSGYDFVATESLNVNSLKDELYRPQTITEDDED